VDEVSQMTLDLQRAMQRLGNDVSLFQEFIGFYEEDYPRLVQSLKKAVDAKDAEGVHQAAHSLKGLVASLGATDVAASASTLERMGRGHDLSEAASTFAKLRSEIDRFNSELASFRNEIQHGQAAK